MLRRGQAVLHTSSSGQGLEHAADTFRYVLNAPSLDRISYCAFIGHMHGGQPHACLPDSEQYLSPDALNDLRPAPPFNILEPPPTYADGRPREDGKAIPWHVSLPSLQPA